MSDTARTDAVEKAWATVVHESWPAAIGAFCGSVEHSRRLEREINSINARNGVAVQRLKALLAVPAVKEVFGAKHELGCACPYCDAQSALNCAMYSK